MTRACKEGELLIFNISRMKKADSWLDGCVEGIYENTMNGFIAAHLFLGGLE